MSMIEKLKAECVELFEGNKRDVEGDIKEGGALSKLKSILEELTEASKYYPYKNKSHLGPGPRKGENDKTRKWDCKCGGYSCDCVNKKTGETKEVNIDPEYKAKYNAEYKEWLGYQKFKAKKRAKKQGK